MKRKCVLRKGLTAFLSLAMVAGLMPATAGSKSVYAATQGELSVTAYATKDDLMNAFTLDSDGNAANVGKLLFGKNEEGVPQEWYILGKDSGVEGDNTAIFVSSPIVNGKVVFATVPESENGEDDDIHHHMEIDDSLLEKEYSADWGCVYEDGVPSSVYVNHYGGSDVRALLNGLEKNTDYFTASEQKLMNATSVVISDKKNSNEYSVADKLYLLTPGDNRTIKAGSNADKTLPSNPYWSSGEWFWLRDPHESIKRGARTTLPVQGPGSGNVDDENYVRPASNLNLTDVLFASAATVATADAAVSGTMSADTAMAIRLDGSGMSIGTVFYDDDNHKITAQKASDATGDVAVVIQGNDGTNDWYYSQVVGEALVVSAEQIEQACNVTGITLADCRIWLETTQDGVTYAVNAVEKDVLTGITAPEAITVANGTAYADMNLPETVGIATLRGTVDTAQVVWDTEKPADGSYDPSASAEQTVCLNGTVICSYWVVSEDVPFSTTIKVTISAAVGGGDSTAGDAEAGKQDSQDTANGGNVTDDGALGGNVTDGGALDGNVSDDGALDGNATDDGVLDGNATDDGALDGNVSDDGALDGNVSDDSDLDESATDDDSSLDDDSDDGQTAEEREEAEWEAATGRAEEQLEAALATQDALFDGKASSAQNDVVGGNTADGLGVPFVSLNINVTGTTARLPLKLLNTMSGRSVLLGLGYNNGSLAAINGSNAVNCTLLDITSEDADELSASQKVKLAAAGLDIANIRSVRVRSDKADSLAFIGMFVPFAGKEGHPVELYYETATSYVKWADAGNVGANGYVWVVIPQVYVNMVVAVR